MPKRSSPASGLVDSWGRRNRSLADKACEACGSVFRPKSKSSRFCSRPCMWSKNGGANRKGGPIWWTNAKGYVEGRVWIDGKRMHAKQHRWIMEGIIGRPLHAWEDVHHKNGIKNDNRPDNLELLSHGEHAAISNSKKDYKRGYTLKLSAAERQRRSEEAIRTRLSERGRTAKAAKRSA